MNKNTIILLGILILVALGVGSYAIPSRSGCVSTDIDGGVSKQLDLPADEEGCGREINALLATIGKGTNASENDEYTAPGGAVPDWRWGLGFVRKVSKNSSGEVVLTIDPALWFRNGYDLGSAQDANLAAQEDSHFIDADAPNGFYIRNESHNLRDIVLPSDALVLLNTTYTNESGGQKLCGGPTLVSSAEVYYSRANKQLTEFPDGLLPVSYDLVDGRITSFAEQYVP